MSLLITRGLGPGGGGIGPGIASDDEPIFVGVVELRPSVQAHGGAEITERPPTVLSAVELTPRTSGLVPVVAPVSGGPQNLSTTELKPKIVKAEEE